MKQTKKRGKVTLAKAWAKFYESDWTKAEQRNLEAAGFQEDAVRDRLIFQAGYRAAIRQQRGAKP